MKDYLQKPSKRDLNQIDTITNLKRSNTLILLTGLPNFLSYLTIDYYF